MTATARTVTAVRGSASDPVVTVTQSVESCSPDQWYRATLVEAASCGSRNPRELCSNTELVQAICDEFGVLNADCSMYRTQRDGARQRVEKMDAMSKRLYQLEDDIATERNRHQVTVLDLEATRETLADAQAEVLRLQALNAKLSAQLAETSHRLIDVSFDHATCAIAKLQAERQTSQCMLFDTSDTTVVDVEVP